MAVMTGLSGNEIDCLHLKGMKPGDPVIGNNVFSMGRIGRTGAGFNSLLEFMATGTAVRRFGNVTTLTPTLPPRAVIRDKNTRIDSSTLLPSRINQPS